MNKNVKVVLFVFGVTGLVVGGYFVIGSAMKSAKRKREEDEQSSGTPMPGANDPSNTFKPPTPPVTVPTPPPAPANTGAFVNGDNVYLKKGQDGASVYSFPESKSTYLLGTIKKSWLLDNPLGVFLNSASDGFVKVTINKHYNVANQPVSGAKDVYVQLNKLAKTPY